MGTAESLYVLNAALLITHQIDSAYWREWELFRIPGGSQLNLLLNLVLLLLVLGGLVLLLQGNRAGQVFSLALALGGGFAFVIHGLFLLRGDRRFRLPVSVGVLVATLIVSALQVVVNVQLLRTA
jgi:uncharacterized protein DUF6713